MQYALEQFKQHGPIVLLLLLALWWLHGRLEQLETRLQNCEADKFQIITQNNERSNEVIRANTTALERNTSFIEAILPALIPNKKRLDALTARHGIPGN